jgi:menaquinone-dependent protoporphyrinogen oxidase
MSTVRILIAYGTSEGQTGRIAEHLAQVIREQGYEASTLDLERRGADEVTGYDGVIVGASVHIGKHQRCVRHFVKENRAQLEGIPSAFFSVSLAARDDSETARQEVQGYVEKFVQETGWRPPMVGFIAGALLYTRYGFFKRWMMKNIARRKGSPDIDTSLDYEYTDWPSVKRFAEEFMEDFALEGAPGAPW